MKPIILHHHGKDRRPLAVNPEAITNVTPCLVFRNGSDGVVEGTALTLFGATMGHIHIAEPYEQVLEYWLAALGESR
jgi:hypothetical protein